MILRYLADLVTGAHWAEKVMLALFAGWVLSLCFGS